MKHKIKYTDCRKPLVGEADSFKEFVEKNKAYLDGAYLMGANLSYADLSEVNLSGAYLMGADFRGADFRGADFRGADLRGADLRGVIGIAPFMSPTSGRICYVVDHGDITMVQIGCFWDSIRQAEITIRERHPTDAADIYIAAMRAAEAVMKYRSKK